MIPSEEYLHGEGAGDKSPCKAILKSTIGETIIVVMLIVMSLGNGKSMRTINF